MSKIEIANDELSEAIRLCMNSNHHTHSNGILDNGSTKWLSRTFDVKHRLDFVPDVLQHSFAFVDYKRNFLKDLERISLSETFSSPNQARVLWSVPTSAMNGPNEDTASYRAALGLKEPPEDYKSLAKQVMKRILKSARFKRIYMREVSQTGFPCFTVGRQAKLHLFKLAIKNADLILDCVLKDDWLRLAKKLGHIPLFTIGTRVQCDNIKLDQDGKIVNKKRPVFSFNAYKHQDFSENYVEYMDYDVSFCSELGDVRGFTAGRARAMYAMSYLFNSLCQIFQNYLYDGLVKVSKCNDYHGPEETAKQISEFVGVAYDPKRPVTADDYQNIVCLDKEQFDTTMSGAIIGLVCEEVETKHERWGRFLYKTITAPVLINSYQRGLNQPFTSRPTINTLLMPSFKSGHGLVAFVGKFLGLIDALYELKLFLGRRFDLDLILSQKHPDVLLFNSGDDTMYVFKNAVEAERFRSAKRIGVHKDSLEDKPVYLGYRYTIFRYYKDCMKLVESLSGSERGTYGKKHHALGMACSFLEYSSAPEAGQILEYAIRNMRTSCGFDLESYIKPYLNWKGGDALREYLVNPEAVFYKLDIEEVPEEIIKEDFVWVEPEFYCDKLGLVA